MTIKRGAFAFILGGALWAAVMVAYLKTHGPGMSDYKRLLFGFSRDNYMLLLSPAALLLGYGLTSLRGRFLPRTGRLFSVASMGAVVLLGLFAAGNLLLTAQVGVGEQLPERIYGPDLIGGVAQFLVPPLLGLCLALTGTALWRARRFRAGAGVLVAPLALIALVPWQAIHSYPGVAFGVAWTVLGLLYATTE